MGPSPVIRRLYTASDWVPTACYGQQTIPTVFPALACRPALLIRPTRVLNAPWRHHGSDDATVTSST